MIFKDLEINDKLPLTCSLEGNCCFGNNVYINPWEIYTLAKGLNMDPKDFIELNTTDGGIKLAFNGKFEKKSIKSCNLYDEKIGCKIHSNRPLACRLFPLGRKIQLNKTNYFFEGKNHPCLDRCPSVLELPKITLKDYLKQQKTENFEKVQDQYLEIIQNLADTAFALYLETEAKLNDKGETLKGWGNLIRENQSEIIKNLSPEWRKIILYPFDLQEDFDSVSFIQNQVKIIENKLQKEIDSIKTLEVIISYSIRIMSISLIIGKSIGANMNEIIQQWISDAKEFAKD